MSSRLEELLEAIVTQNAQIIEHLSDISEAISELDNKVDDVASNSEQIGDIEGKLHGLDELSWIAEHSFAKMLLEQLSSIDQKLFNIDMNTTS